MIFGCKRNNVGTQKLCDSVIIIIIIVIKEKRVNCVYLDII